MSASPESRCVLTEAYSPTAMLSALATRPASPAVMVTEMSDVAPAAPATRPAVEMTPSFAPSSWRAVS